MSGAYATFSIILAGVIATAAIAGVALSARHEPTFLRRTYWKWVATAIGITVLAHVVYLDTPWPALLGKLVIAYGMLIGVLVGGVVGVFVPNAKRAG